MLGWREWATFPRIDGVTIKAKLDTGARTSSLHAFDLRRFSRDGQEFANFEIHPHQRSNADAVRAEYPIIEDRVVRSSTGRVERRPVVRTPLSLGGLTFECELTLTRRDAMGFRLLIGREALRRRFVVDPARSFIAGTPTR